MPDTTQTIGVFFGGQSPEHDVSIITGTLIIAGLKRLGYGVMPVYVDKEGGWNCGDELASIEFYKKEPLPLQKYKGFSVDLDAPAGTMVLVRRGLVSKKYLINVAFPAFHGQNGEDGTMQGLFEMLGVPYVGCGVAASALAMDKVLTKLMYEAQGFPTTKFSFFLKREWEADARDVLARIEQKLRYPLFVKPARLGSSIGIARVSKREDLETAIEVALHYDEKILVEEGVEHVSDITCAVIGNDTPVPSLLQESVFGGGFLSYDDKYMSDGGTQLGKASANIIIPAHVDEKTEERITEYALSVYRAFECSGIARIDFLYNRETKGIFINEINTLPGTLYHHLWKESGVELEVLLSRLLGYAAERHEKKKKFIRTFESAILKHADWSKKLNPKKNG